MEGERMMPKLGTEQFLVTIRTKDRNHIWTPAWKRTITANGMTDAHVRAVEEYGLDDYIDYHIRVTPVGQFRPNVRKWH